VLTLFEKDARWVALDDELEREELFEEYALSLERKETAERRAKRKERMADFRKLLEDTPTVSVTSQWRRVQSMLDDKDAFRALDKIDRLAVFEEYTPPAAPSPGGPTGGHPLMAPAPFMPALSRPLSTRRHHTSERRDAT
jgi:hypothetical protein